MHDLSKSFDEIAKVVNEKSKNAVLFFEDYNAKNVDGHVVMVHRIFHDSLRYFIELNKF